MDLFCPKCHTQFTIDPGQFEKKPEPKKVKWTFKRIIKLFLSVAILYAIGYVVFNTDLVLKHQKSKQETVQKIAEKPKQDVPDKNNERIIYLDE